MNEISNKAFHIITPLIDSKILTDLSRTENESTQVYLKLENIQPSGSFKIRGIGNHILTKLRSNPEYKDLVIASGGNAGLAASYVASKLQIPIKVVVPESSTKSTVKNLKLMGAEVIQFGSAWDEANMKVLEFCTNSINSAYISPFEDPSIWYGNSTIIDEIKEQLSGVKPDCIITAFGGGGLFNGILEGLIRNNWLEGVDIIAAETEGANCYNLAIKNGKPITMDKISSIAVTLGAKTCSPKSFEYYEKYRSNIKSVVVSDKEALNACLKFLDDHKMLVEVSCGACLAIAYNLDKKLEKRYKNIVVIVCGGSGINLEEIMLHKNNFKL